MGIGTIGEINEKISRGEALDMILTAEARQEADIARVASQIATRQEVKCVMIAGPSSSGKTSFSHRLSARRGEKKNIIPFQESADVVFNSSLVYEFSVIKNYAEHLIFGIPEDAPEFLEANRLLKFLDYFLAIDSTLVPQNSLLREFVGGSVFGV